MLRMIYRTFTPCCYPMNFLTIWIAEQVVSFVHPITDLFTTIAMLFIQNRTSLLLASQVFMSSLYILIFLYRIIQNLKFWYELTQEKQNKQYDFWAPPFLGFLRAFFALLASTAGMMNGLKFYDKAMIVWIILGVIATLISWYVDVRGDWGLLQHQSRYVLRKDLLFPKQKYVYYFIGIFDLALRTGWILTISSFALAAGSGVWPM